MWFNSVIVSPTEPHPTMEAILWYCLVENSRTKETPVSVLVEDNVISRILDIAQHVICIQIECSKTGIGYFRRSINGLGRCVRTFFPAQHALIACVTQDALLEIGIDHVVFQAHE
jgi:hypothetical protein